MRLSNLRRFLGLHALIPLAFCLLALWAVDSARTQEEFGAPDGQADSRVVISYGSVTAYVDSPVELPLYLTAPFEVGSVVSELRLPKAMLQFDKARKSDVLTSSGDALLEAVVADDLKDKTFALLKVTIRAPSNKALPSGLLALVTFKVATDAQPGDVKLEHRATARVPASSNDMLGVVSESPRISIHPKGISPN